MFYGEMNFSSILWFEQEKLTKKPISKFFCSAQFINMSLQLLYNFIFYFYVTKQLDWQCWERPVGVGNPGRPLWGRRQLSLSRSEWSSESAALLVKTMIWFFLKALLWFTSRWWRSVFPSPGFDKDVFSSRGCTEYGQRNLINKVFEKEVFSCNDLWHSRSFLGQTVVVYLHTPETRSTMTWLELREFHWRYILWYWTSGLLVRRDNQCRILSHSHWAKHDTNIDMRVVHS